MRALALGITVICSVTLFSQSLTAYFDYKVFLLPDNGILLETYVDVTGSSVAYLPVNDSLNRAEIEMNIILSNVETVVDFKKEIVQSPLAYSDYTPDFMSLNRFLLPSGKYTLELIMKDLGKEEDAVTTMRTIDLQLDIDACSFSDIELIAGFRPAAQDARMAKSGFEFIPYMSNLYGETFNELLFYVELYHTEKSLGSDEGFVLSYALEDSKSNRTIAECEVVKRKKSAEVITEMGRLDLSKVPSGLYILNIEARNRENEVIASKELQIIRQNGALAKEYSPEDIELSFIGKMNDKDSLIAYIDCLHPVAREYERTVIDYQIKNSSLLECKSFFYSFWEARNLIDPSKAWNEYKEQVRIAEEKFGTSNKRGYSTDMGRVYLQYGPPNSVVDRSSDPQSYPYQIWHYYRAGKFSDKRFVFYDRELLQREYQLLHSDVPGEVRNPRWDMVLNSRNNAQWNQEQNSAGGSSSERMQELFEMPR
jgi:GWxTD domain-containing protein